MNENPYLLLTPTEALRIQNHIKEQSAEDDLLSRTVAETQAQTLGYINKVKSTGKARVLITGARRKRLQKIMVLVLGLLAGYGLGFALISLQENFGVLPF